jgi:hypothetical protein
MLTSTCMGLSFEHDRGSRERAHQQESVVHEAVYCGTCMKSRHTTGGFMGFRLDQPSVSRLCSVLAIDLESQPSGTQPDLVQAFL